ncbi:hypothetical protein CUN61_09940 [Pseudomonas arsenicoxydans]|uniref:Uncharacterized protein n=1 Tax=Pseudomonas arsenicoxydans TaxID=702115 RepID=A0A4P6FZC2_9PSED|nr:hypothetical protein CUN61_09940 [Pseudomonas arsenicoxydans]
MLCALQEGIWRGSLTVTELQAASLKLSDRSLTLRGNASMDAEHPGLHAHAERGSDPEVR